MADSYTDYLRPGTLESARRLRPFPVKPLELQILLWDAKYLSSCLMASYLKPHNQSPGRRR